jgi:hypothetical protein
MWQEHQIQMANFDMTRLRVIWLSLEDERRLMLASVGAH